MLESFGAKVSTGTSQFWIDFVYPSEIREAEDQVSGILVQHVDGLKIMPLAVESFFWKNKNLPVIMTFGEFLRNADVIVAQLQSAQARTFNYRDVDRQAFRRYVIIRFNDKPGMPPQTSKH